MTSGSQRVIEGTIKILRCDSCDATFPHFVFSGEEDTDTDRLCSASSCGRNEVVLVEAESDEWRDLHHGGTLAIERRLNALLKRSDLKIPQMLAVEQHSAPAAGISFKDFRKTYKPPVVVYACVCCASGKSRAIAEVTAKDFQAAGGLVINTGRLRLQVES